MGYKSIADNMGLSSFT